MGNAWKAGLVIVCLAAAGTLLRGEAQAKPPAAPVEGEDGRYRLVAGPYSVQVRSAFVETQGIFKVDTRTGEAWVYSEINSEKMNDGEILKKREWKAIAE